MMHRKNTRSGFRGRAAFTLIEMLIVVAIAAILSIVVILNIQGSKGTTDLNSSTKQVVALLRQAQSQSASGQGGNTWGVYFASANAALNGYSYQRAITINAAYVSSTITNYPMLFSGTYSYLAATSSAGLVQNPNGYDIIFTSDSACANKLNFQTEGYTPGSGYITDWVQVPSVSNTTNTVIYLCYGNASVAAKQANATSTWNNQSLAAYWQVGEGSGSTTPDLSGNGANGVWNGTPGGTSGYYANVTPFGPWAGYFNGSNDYVSVANNFGSLPTTGSITFWARASSLSSYPNPFTTNNAGSNNAIRYEQNGSTIYAVIGNGSYNLYNFSTSMAANTWYQYVTTWNTSATTVTGYFNGSQVFKDTASSLWPSTVPTVTFGLGWGSRYWAGYISDVRLYNRTLSSGEVLTTYNNETSPGTFYTIGSQALGGSGGVTASFFSFVSSSTYSSSTSVGYYKLPSTVGFTPATLLPGANMLVSFSPISGFASASTSIGLYLISNPSISSTIRIASTGVVSY